MGIVRVGIADTKKGLERVTVRIGLNKQSPDTLSKPFPATGIRLQQQGNSNPLLSWCKIYLITTHKYNNIKLNLILKGVNYV